MKTITTEKRVHVVKCLVEGNSIRSTVRLTSVAKNTIVKLLVQLGDVCAAYQNSTLRNLPCKRVQCDGIHSFCYAKDKNVPADKQGQFGFGSVWTWTALCADTKLIPSWRVGTRSAGTAHEFMHDLASRLANRVQLTTDGHMVYLDAVERGFGLEIDYAMLVKIYGVDRDESEVRYSPPECIGYREQKIIGSPNPKHISTSFVESQNLSMRMSMRRFTRLTNAFSKKVVNHTAAIALYFMYYNFCRIHQTLRVTPAMEVGVSDHVWKINEIIALLPALEYGPRGPYKKRISR